MHFFFFLNQLLTWDVGKINPQKLPSLKGTMSLQAGASKPDENPTINIQFKIQQMAISGTHTPSEPHVHVHVTVAFQEFLHFLFLILSLLALSDQAEH